MTGASQRIDPADNDTLPWLPSLDDLVPAARQALEARAPQGRLRTSYLEGALFALYWYGARDAFTRWEGD